MLGTACAGLCMGRVEMWGVVLLSPMMMFDKVNGVGGSSNSSNIRVMKTMYSRRMARRFSVRMANGVVGVAIGILLLKWLFQITRDVDEISLMQGNNTVNIGHSALYW